MAQHVLGAVRPVVDKLKLAAVSMACWFSLRGTGTISLLQIINGAVCLPSSVPTSSNQNLKEKKILFV